MTNRVASIQEFGQKIWLDNISREFLTSGNLHKMIAEDKIAGLTSNPAIFYKAISTDPRYQNQLAKLKKTSMSPEARYEEIVIVDIKNACEIMHSLYESSHGEDGYVSLEVSPHLAHDAKGTVECALDLWQRVDKPNLMIKVPATPEGVIAFEELITMGLNVNITLLFSLVQVNAIWEAYLRAIDKRVAQNSPVDKIKAVASFFLSRVDSAVDDKLPVSLQGKTAINLAKAAYLDYQKLFYSEHFAKLQAKGAKGQQLLWASTGTKNKNYSDVLYIEELIGAETINTVPDATLDAFRDHGVAKERLTIGIQNSTEILQQVEKHGINLTELGENLQRDGLKLFEEAFDKLIELVK